MVFALGNATSMKQMLEEKKVAKGIWYDDGRIALYRTSAIVEHNKMDKMAFLCPKKFDKALLHKTGSSRQAYCYSTFDTEIDQLYRNLRETYGTIEPIPIVLRDYSADEEDQDIYIEQIIINGFDVEEQNKIESDLYQFLLGYADTVSSGGTDNFIDFKVSDRATPCFVTRQSSDNEAYSSWYFEVDSPDFTFKRENFHLKGVMYNKMYCDEKTKFENEPRICEEEHSTADNHVFLLVVKFAIIFIACVAIIAIVQLCYNTPDKKQRKVKKVKKKMKKTVQV